MHLGKSMVRQSRQTPGPVSGGRGHVLPKASACLGLLLAGLWAAPALAQGLVPQDWLLPSGPAGEQAYFKDRVRLDFSTASGGETPTTSELVAAPDFAENEYWRREVELDVDVLRSRDFSLGFTGGFFDARTPTSGGRGLNIGEPPGWQEKMVQDLGLDLGLFGDRLHYATGLSWSRDEGSSDSVFDTTASLADDDDEETGAGEGSARWHRLDAVIYEGGAFDLSAYGYQSLIDPSYGSRQHLGDLFAMAEGEKPKAGQSWGLGGKIGLGFAEVSLSHSVISASDKETRAVGGALDFGIVSFELSQAIKTDFDEADSGAWSSRTRSWEAAVTVDLDEYRMAGDGGGDFALESLLPSSITFTGERGKVTLAHAPDDPKDLETTFGVDLYWEWGGMADTSLGFYQTNYDSREIGAESADDVDRLLDISQGFYGNNWDVSAYLSLNDYRYLETGSASRDWMYSGGISFSIAPEDLPGLSLSLDVDGFDSIYFDDDYSSNDRSWGLDAVLDFSKFLPVADADRKPYLKLTYQMEGTATEDSEAGASTDWGFALLLLGGIRF